MSPWYWVIGVFSLLGMYFVFICVLSGIEAWQRHRKNRGIRFTKRTYKKAIARSKESIITGVLEHARWNFVTRFNLKEYEKHIMVLPLLYKRARRERSKDTFA
jgi:hypothetical protein